MKIFAIGMTVGALLVACGGGGGEAPPPATAAEPGAAPGGAVAPSTFTEQVSAGQKLYAAHCARCHGDTGEGSEKAPRVVGMSAGALPLEPPPARKQRKTQFRTAADVADFVVKNMPPNKAGTLSESQYWAILAFDLHANGVMLDKPLDASSAGEVVLHK